MPPGNGAAECVGFDETKYRPRGSLDSKGFHQGATAIARIQPIGLEGNTPSIIYVTSLMFGYFETEGSENTDIIHAGIPNSACA